MAATPQAHYRLEAKIHGRQAKDKAGKAIAGKQVSIVAKAAYRSGNTLRDEKTEKTFNYSSRSQEVTYSEILAPDHAASWLKSGGSDKEQQRVLRERLWNTIEKAEKRKDSQLAREFIISLPVQLTREQQIEAVQTWCTSELTSKGFVADFNLHKSKDGKNPHAHVLATLRPVEGEAFGKKPDMAGKFNGRAAAGLGVKTDLLAWRESWEKAVNGELEKAGRDERADSRSLKTRGIPRLPEPKVGVEAVAMQRKGSEHDPLRFQQRRVVNLLNQVMPQVRHIFHKGQIRQRGGITLLSQSLERVKSAGMELGKTMKGGWQKYVESRRERAFEPEH